MRDVVEAKDYDALLAQAEAMAVCVQLFEGYCTDEFAPTPMKMAREALKSWQKFKEQK